MTDTPRWGPAGAAERDLLLLFLLLLLLLQRDGRRRAPRSRRII
jgi:hypothetical protein